MKKRRAIAIFLATCHAILTLSSANGQETTPDALRHQPSVPGELTEHEQELLALRIDLILQKDQQFRSYLSFGTMNEEEIKRVNRLDAQGQLQAMADKKSELSSEIKALLNQLQKKNDIENYAEFYDIVRTYGYPSPERLGRSEDRLFVLLLHPPVEQRQINAHTRELCKLLLPEVKAGRMEPKSYALFVDNMRGKIQRRPQLYGTNQQFDQATGTILPPQIEDVQKSNRARREIGLPELKEGEYRLASGVH
jgi:hypothetical protein